MDVQLSPCLTCIYTLSELRYNPNLFISLQFVDAQVYLTLFFLEVVGTTALVFQLYLFGCPLRAKHFTEHMYIIYKNVL